MPPINVVALISPAAGKESTVSSVLSQLARDVQTHEPGAIRYQPYKQADAEGSNTDFVVVEQYKDLEAYQNHFQTEYFKKIGERIGAEGLLAGPLRIMRLEGLEGGFER